MASVMKMFHNFKSSHGIEKRQSTEKKNGKTEIGRGRRDDGNAEEGALPSDLLNRRRVSISKSGRYKENHKKRSALPEEGKKRKENDGSSSVYNKENLDKEKERNKENEKNRENILTRSDSITSEVEDGHAVADEIASLARSLTTAEYQGNESAL